MEIIINKKELEIKIVNIKMERKECILYLRITPYGKETIRTHGYYRNKNIYCTFKIENKKYVKEVDEKNKLLLKLKMTIGKITQDKNNFKKNLNSYMNYGKLLRLN